MGDSKGKKSTVGRNQSSPYRSFAFVPVPIDDRYRRMPMLMQKQTWWQRCTRWLAYYSIQFRWNIERRIARLFHRRWGG